MPQIRIEAGEHTETLAQYILGGLNEAALDATEVERESPTPTGLVCEPATTALILTVSVGTAALIARSVERWLESRRQETMMRLTLEGFQHSDEAGQALAKLAARHTAVSLKYGMPKANPTRDR